MNRKELKQLIRESLKEVLNEIDPHYNQKIRPDQRIKFDIDMNHKGNFVVKYRENAVGSLVIQQDGTYKFLSQDPNFMVINGRTGSAEILKAALLGVVNFRIEKPQ